MFHLFFDEDSLDRGLIAGARQLGFDCLSVATEGRWGLADEFQLEFAASLDRVVFTSNVGHFVRLHYEWLTEGRRHAGIIVLTEQTMPVGAQIRALEAVAKAFSPEDMRDRLVFLANHRRGLE